jgi:7,8-dihydro-6-hydroxymethylpterin dimethyltransferase
VPEIRQQILDGKTPLEVLYTDKPGEIKAQVIERDGKILMVKDCPIHGHFEDVMAIDTAFFKHLEDVFPGRDIRAHNDSTAAQARFQHGHPRPRLGADRST